jgi:hypothetical protein
VFKTKRGIQWDRSQIRVWVGPLYLFFFTHVDLYSDMNTSAALECPNF